ncbi:hypothetical protein ACX27_01760 [Nostoc piscinale CENA21]|uniref:Uncharacterized protein n=1 Tax=Nostoc piscinale CENA21 TaxID=224013 RepID=A0A0M3V4F7_9NOSO|nr:hypothetical protein [Nostoc piscinale]ALF51857.1 hypothetical protein ACX27_01760 [Nostoc piscinale CENA21]
MASPTPKANALRICDRLEIHYFWTSKKYHKPMKVKKLIEHLQELDPELNVLIHDVDFDEIYTLIAIRAIEKTVRLQFNGDEPK